MTAAVKEKSELSLFVRRKIDDSGLNPYEFRIYTQITRRSDNSNTFPSFANMAHACRMGLSRAGKTLQPLNLVEITQ